MELETQLASVPLFAGLDDRVRRRLSEVGTRRTFRPDEPIVRENAFGTGLYVILSGRVRVNRAGTPVNELGSNDFFGELSLIEKEPRSASVVATEPTECLVLPVWEFRSLLNEHPEIAVPIMHALIERLHRSEQRSG